MMKWGRKKHSSSSSPSHTSSISQVFPMTWLSKFKQKQVKGKQKENPSSTSPHMPIPAVWRESQFCGENGDDSHWRLSFGEERIEGAKSGGNLQSVSYELDDELQLPWNVGISPEIVEAGSERQRKGFRIPRKNATKDQKPKWAELESKAKKAEEVAAVPEEKDIFELKPVRTSQKATLFDSRRHCCRVSSVKSRGLKTIEEDCQFENLNLEEQNGGLSEEKLSSEWQKLKDMKIEELKSKTERQRKSVYISREQQRRTKQSSKVRVYSPRTVAKIKALEDKKRAKRKMKKTKPIPVEGRMAFDSFAEVKSSQDPQEDFRRSMVEMIIAKGIRRSEELEELLACYLTLNADEYHDLIIKVFRNVWFELNRENFGPESQNEHSYYY